MGGGIEYACYDVRPALYTPPATRACRNVLRKCSPCIPDPEALPPQQVLHELPLILMLDAATSNPGGGGDDDDGGGGDGGGDGGGGGDAKSDHWPHTHDPNTGPTLIQP